jgi:hypothetical protein
MNIETMASTQETFLSRGRPILSGLNCNTGLRTTLHVLKEVVGIHAGMLQVPQP